MSLNKKVVWANYFNHQFILRKFIIMSILLTVVVIINSLILSIIALGVATIAYMDVQESRRAKNSKPRPTYCYRCEEEIREDEEWESSEYNKDDEEERVETVKCSRVFQCL